MMQLSSLGKNGYAFEKQIKDFLRDNGLAFEEHKKWIGHGGKTWVTDFYLPEYSTVIEAKVITNIKSIELGKGGSRRIAIYQDLFKLNELETRYGITKVLCLSLEKGGKFPHHLLSNITAHGIYVITDISQIIPITQGKNVYKSNSTMMRTLFKNGQMKPNFNNTNSGFLERAILDPIDPNKFLETKSVEFQMLIDYAKGNSTCSIAEKYKLKDRTVVVRNLRKAMTVLLKVYLNEQFQNSDLSKYTIVKKEDGNL